MNEVTITMTTEQARLLVAILDTHSRLGMGQLEIAVGEYLSGNFRVPGDDFPTREVRDTLEELKGIVFTYFGDGPFGIYHPKVPANARQAYDMQQVLRKELAENAITYFRSQGEFEHAKHVLSTVDMKPFMPADPETPPIKVVVRTEP